MRAIAATLLSCLVAVGVAQAAESESERASRATEQYARCLDNVLGNFSKNADAQAAAQKLANAMLVNIRALIASERTKPSPTTRFWMETLGEEAFVGYLFKSFSDVNEEYRAERQALKEKNNFDWRRTHQQLWSKYGCDAIFSQLSR